MTKHQAVRPAGLAIAAFLASVSPAAMAQTVAPPAPAPAAPVQVAPPGFMSVPGAMSPAPAPPSAPVFAPNQPVVQATPSVEERRAAAVAAAEAEGTVRSENARPAPVTPRAATPRPVPAAAAAPAVPAPAQDRAERAPAAIPPATPVTAAGEAAPASSPAPAPVVASQDNGLDQSLLWALGGGALLFLGIGASAVLRRRRREEGGLDHARESDDAVATAPRTSPTPVVAPVMATPAPAAYEPPLRAPAAPAPAGGTSPSTLAAMVAAPPSADNPFRTQPKRTRRARYLLAQREMAARAPERSRVAPPPQTIAAEDRSQTVYSFGKQGRRSGGFKPRNA